MTIDNRELNRRFWPHTLSITQQQVTSNVRSGFQDLAVAVSRQTPDCREQDLALTQLEQALMWAVAAIARTPPEG